MATISNNEIKIKYSLDTTDLANATALFDRLSAEDRQLLNDLKKLQAQLTATGQAGQTAGQNIGNGLTNARNKSKGLLDDFVQMQNPIKQIGTLLVTAFSVQSLIRFGKTVLDTTIKMESLRKAIEFTSGSVTAGLVNFQFLEKVAKELGLPLEAAAEGFKGFSAAAQRAGITLENQQKMFVDLSKAMAALQVTSQDAQLIFFGFSQLMSKAKVSAQELYHQIGERLPLAMEAAQIAAGRLTGQTKVTTSELMRMVEGGKLLSEKFAPEFTKALGELAGDAAYVETLGKSFTRLGNAWTEMLDAMGKDNEGFVGNTMKLFTGLFNKIKENIKGFQTSVEFEQSSAFENAVKKSQKLTNEQIEFRLLILEKQKELAEEEVKTINDRVTAQEFLNKNIAIGGGIVGSILGYSEDEFKADQKKLEDAKLKLASLQGTVDAFNKTLKERQPIITKDELDDTKEAENLYKKLIADLENARKAEENYIKARTKPGYERDIEILKNNVDFNEQMLKIDEDARFKELDLAKRNAKLRKSENELFKQEELNIAKKANDEALKIQQDFLDKSNEELRKAQDQRRQDIQTDQQNELEQSAKFQKERLDQLVQETNKALAVQALAPETRAKLMQDLQDQMTAIEKEGEAERDSIRQYYFKKMLRDTEIANFEREQIMVQANTIRLSALTKGEEQKQIIINQGSLDEIKIEKEKIKRRMLDIITNNKLEVKERQNQNSILTAELLKLQAQEVQITENTERLKKAIRESYVQATINIIQTLSEGLTSRYVALLNNEMTVLQKRYDLEVKLADGNQQKIDELNQRKAEKEKEIRIKIFKAEQQMAVARVMFETASIVAKWSSNPVTLPLAILTLANQAAQVAMILAQPVPEFAEGTKGKKFKGGPAIVGERGVEKVITESGKVYYTPDHASLVELPKGSQVIPNHALSQKELFWANALNNGKPIPSGNGLERKLDEIGGILRELPVHQINMDERGFEKYIRTPRRSTRILNNRFGIKN